MWQRMLQCGSTSNMVFIFKIRHESVDASTTYFDVYDMNDTLLYRDTTDTQYGQNYSFNKTYTLNGTKCIVKTKVKVCTCPKGTVQTSDKLYCIKTNSKTTYSCENYPGYTLNGTKCTKTTTTQKITYSCDKGYILNGTSCVKTVNTSSTKNAEAIYNTHCEQKYNLHLLPETFSLIYHIFPYLKAA